MPEGVSCYESRGFPRFCLNRAVVAAPFGRVPSPTLCAERHDRGYLHCSNPRKINASPVVNLVHSHLRCLAAGGDQP
jgi:hypothetical protein